MSQLDVQESGQMISGALMGLIGQTATLRLVVFSHDGRIISEREIVGEITEDTDYSFTVYERMRGSDCILIASVKYELVNLINISHNKINVFACVNLRDLED